MRYFAGNRSMNPFDTSMNCSSKKKGKLAAGSGAAGQRGPGSFRRFRAMPGANSEVLVGDNQLLKKEDPIARLDPRDYEMSTVGESSCSKCPEDGSQGNLRST
jgi:hypothetical protein